VNRKSLFRPMCFPFVAIVSLFGAGPVAAQTAAPAPNGITLPQGYKDWRVIAVSHRSDNDTMRVIVGNDRAIDAARSGKTNPWPDGAILGKIVWKNKKHEAWPTATVPGDFRAQEFMIKDASRFAKTGGWGYARWLGAERKPYGKDANFDQECYGCHTPVKANDYVFTHPVKIP
jgi:Cytochrome P460